MSLVTQSIQHSVATITFNRSEAANALSIGLLNEYIHTIKALQQDESVRIIMITGEGDRAFCSGADLKERMGMSIKKSKETIALINEAVNETEACKLPTIALLNGSAFGGGLELALAADFRIASENAKVGLTETSLGIIPGAGGTQRLPRLVGMSKAKELIYTACRLTAKEALAIGLIDYVYSAKTYTDEAMRFAKTIAMNAPLAIEQAKKAIQLGIQTDISSGLQIESLAYERLLMTTDRLEGLQAFKEKRKPLYKGQ